MTYSNIKTKQILSGSLIAICFFILFPNTISANALSDTKNTKVENNLGEAILEHFDTDLFEGNSTNWFVQQGNDGVIFMSNNGGLYSYDGAKWRHHNNNARHLGDIRQFRIHSDQRIYVAADSDFGYFETIENGDLRFQSLLSQLKKKEQTVTTFSHVFVQHKSVVFIAPERMVILNAQGVIDTLEPAKQFSRAWQVNNKIFLTDGKELKVYDGHQIADTPFNSSMGEKNFSFVEGVEKGILVGTYSQGIYLWDDQNITLWLAADSPLADLGLYNRLKINDDLIAVNTINGGVLFFNAEGDLVYQLNNKNGLLTNITLSLYLDEQQGLWLSQEGQLVRAQLPFELSIYSSKKYTLAKVRAISQFKDTIYLSAINGIKLIRTNGDLESLNKTVGSSADLLQYNEQLIIAGAQQCQVLDLNSQMLITLLNTPYCRDLLLVEKNSVSLFMITKKDIRVSLFENGQWQEPIIIVNNMNISSQLVEDQHGQVWTANNKGQLIRIIRIWFDSKWLGEVIHVHNMELIPLVIRGQLHLASEQGFFYWDEKKQMLGKKVSWYYQQFGQDAAAPNFSFVDKKDRLWLSSSETAGYFNIGEYTKLNKEIMQWNNYPITASNMKEIRSVFEFNNVIWIGSNQGVIRYSPSPMPKFSAIQISKAFISEVENRQLTIYRNSTLSENNNNETTASAKDSSFRVYFSLTSFLHSKKNQYRYRINNNLWSKWSNESYIDLGTLSGGEYLLSMQAKDFQNKTYFSEAHRLKILAPWYLSPLAFGCYFVIFLCSVYLVIVFLVKMRTQTILNKNKKLEDEINSRTVTIRKQSKILEEQAEAKNRFFSNVSHEFRTPLTLAIGPLSTLLKDELVSSQKRYVKLALDNCQKMLKLVGQILDINRLASGDMPIMLSKIDLNAKISEIVEDYQMLAESLKLTLIWEPKVRSHFCYFDENHFETILNNLLTNAFKYCQPDSAIEVSVIEETESILIEVIDDGPGIPTSEQDFVFERYYQGRSTSQLTPGTGIGLSMVKELMEIHSGEVHLKTGRKKGCHFVLSIKKGNSHYSSDQIKELTMVPCESLPTKTTEKVSIIKNDTYFDDTPYMSNNDMRVRVLVVDDNKDIRFFIRDSLQPNYQIIEASNGQDGLQQIIDKSPDFIICDIMMPIMDGKQLTERLKADVSLAHIPLMLLTAKSTKREIVEGLQYGADDYLTKPFDSSELIARIEAHLTQKRNIARSIYKEHLTLQKPPITGHNIEFDFQTQSQRFQMEFIKIVEDNLAEVEFGIDEMAAQLNVERSSLFRKVKKYYKCTPNQYLKKQRLTLALQLLKSEKGTVSEIAYAVGFQSLNYFSRSFREYYHVPPSQYKNV